MPGWIPWHYCALNLGIWGGRRCGLMCWAALGHSPCHSRAAKWLLKPTAKGSDTASLQHMDLSQVPTLCPGQWVTCQPISLSLVPRRSEIPPTTVSDKTKWQDMSQGWISQESYGPYERRIPFFWWVRTADSTVAVQWHQSLAGTCEDP